MAKERDVLGQLCALLRSGDAELQCAAAKVLGALKINDEGVRKALVGTYRSGVPMVVGYAVDALGRLGDPAAVPDLIAAFAAPQAARDRALAAVASFGPAAVPALREALGSHDLAIRRGAVDVLGRIPGGETLGALLEMVGNSDEESVRIATGQIRRRIEGMGEKDRDALVAAVRTKLEAAPKKKAAAGKRGAKTEATSPSVSEAAKVALVKLLGFLQRPSGAPVLLDHLDPKFSAAVRRNALVSLSHVDLSGADPKAVAERVLPLLAEADFNQIAGPALSVVQRLPVPKALAPQLAKLRESPHGAVKAFAVRALGTVGTAQAADALIGQLASPDQREREMAQTALRGNAEHAPRLAAALEKEKDPAVAWAIAQVLRSFRETLDKALVKKLLAAGLARLAKQDEALGKAFIESVRFAAPDVTREALLKQGTAWQAKGKHEAAECFLRWLERDEMATPDGLYALALTRLKRGVTSLDPGAQGKNPALPLFTRIARQGEFPFAKRFAADRKLLAPADLLYVGFHFVEQQGPERAVGAEALKALVKLFPKSAEAKGAKQRLGMEKLG